MAEHMPPVVPKGASESYISADDESFHAVLAAVSGARAVLIGLFAAQDFEEKRGFTLFYIFEKRECPDIVIVERALKGAEAASIADLFPAASWFERETRDGFGIEFTGAFDRRRLFLHETYPEDFHPLLKSFKNQPIVTRQSVPPESEYRFRVLDGEGVYEIPVGPVHAGIIEPGHFRFSVIGETIFNLEIRMFYKHRGIEKLAEGKSVADAVAVAETISGDESVTNAVGYSMAVEKIAGASVPERAWQLRTIFMEMERIYSHLGDMAGMVVDVAYPAGAARFFKLREEVFRQNQALSGSRFLKGVVCPGGLRKDVSAPAIEALDRYLVSFLPEFERAVEIIHASTSVVDRFETTGVIEPRLIGPLNITGPAARASGTAIDIRLDHPYGIYPRLPLSKRTATSGDVLARFDVKAAEIVDSVGIIRSVLGGIKAGTVRCPVEAMDGYGLALVEAPRGQNLHWVYVRDGVIERYKVRTASFCNWQAIRHAVLGNIVPDFPLINKSLNLSYAGTDL
ncbi:MAG: hydrogenase large subunit [Chloroflexi bacterium]|nr:hydrogenase large subunit [Chloroflexota bacterium]